MTEVGDYVIQFVDLLGGGTFSRVYKGHHKTTNEKVAAKNILLNRQNRGYVKHQVQVLKLRKGHENILQIFFDKLEKKELWIIMEYCDLGNLAEYAEKHPLDLYAKLDIVHQSTNALVYLLSLKPKAVVHRDVKPANVLLSSREREVLVKLCDFGLAKPVNTTTLDTKCGTTHYKAPELFEEDPKYDRSVDVFALGILILHLIRAKVLQNLESKEVLKDPIGQLMFKMKANREIWRPVVLSMDDSMPILEVKWLIGNMVVLDPGKRLTMEIVHEEVGRIKDALLPKTKVFITYCFHKTFHSIFIG